MSTLRRFGMGAGWSRPGKAQKYHYFRRDNTTSLCRQWMIRGPLIKMTRLEDRCQGCSKRYSAAPQSQAKGER